MIVYIIIRTLDRTPQQIGQSTKVLFFSHPKNVENTVNLHILVGFVLLNLLKSQFTSIKCSSNFMLALQENTREIQYQEVL